MNTKSLANHYSQLTPEERFRLIMAANARSDEAEVDRLANAGQRITMSMSAHSPYARAFEELNFAIYIDLLDQAAETVRCARRSRSHLRRRPVFVRRPQRRLRGSPSPSCAFDPTIAPWVISKPGSTRKSP